MKRITLILCFVTVLVQSSFAYWTNLQNTGTPTATYYLGDKLQYVFYFDINNDTYGWPNPQYGIGKTTDGTDWIWYNATYNTNNGSNWTWKSNANEAQFTSVGNWFYSGKYTNSSSYIEYACKAWSQNITSLSGNVSSYFTVSELENPTSQTASAASITQVNLSWTKWNSKNVMIVRRLTSAAASNAPTQGTAYSVNATLGTGTVVYNSNGTSFNDTGLTPGTSYTYIFYSENNSYYSPEATAVASTNTQTTAASDYFRSKATGNWNTAGTWESSPNNINWITSSLVPDASATTITILSGHNVTLDINATIAGLIINSDATFTASDATPRTLTITKSTSGSSTTLSNSGTWVNSTVGSTVVFTGAPSSGDAIHAISGIISFQNLTVNKTDGSSNVGASFGTNSSLTGTLEIGTGGYISTNPPTGFYDTGAILKFNQGALATYDVNTGDKTWSTTEVPQNITVTSGKVRVNENRTATGNLIVLADGTLELAAAKQLSINGTLTNNGTLTLKSADGIGTASIITLGTVDGSGTTNVEQYVSSAAMGTTGRNWYISSPLTEASVSTITTETGNDLVYRNGSVWSNASGTMEVMKGYIAKSPNGSKTIKFTGGSLNTGNQSVSNLPAGFNLVGNPYASFVDFSQATKTGVTNSIWYRSKSSGSYVFQTYNVSSNIGANDGSAIIPPLQSFWIKTTSGTNTFGFTNTMRSHQDQSVATNRLKAPAVSTQKLLRLEIANGTDKDETVVYFNENALNTFDEYDSQKMFNDIAGVPEIYTHTDSKDLVINGFNTIQLNTEIPLGFRTGLTEPTNLYTIKATQLQNFDTDTELVLIDKTISNSETIMSEGSEYSFNSAAVNTTNRFSIVFRAKGTTTGGCCNTNEYKDILVYKNANNQVCIDLKSELNKVQNIAIYNTMGQRITETKPMQANTMLNVAFETGVYFVKLNIDNKTITRKVIIK